MMSREQLHHLSGAYVLNALDEDERRAFEERLSEWDDMRSEVIELADTAAALGLALPPVQPRSDLRGRLLDRVAEIPQLTPTEAMTARPRQHAVPRRRRPSIRLFLRGRPAPLLWVVAAIAAVVGVLVVGPALLPDRVGSDVSLAQVAEAADARRVSVPLAGGNEVELVWSEDLTASALTWRSLPPLEEGRVYELWYVDDSPRPAGLVTDGGPGGRVLDGEMRPGDRVAVTIEPAGGSAQPTTEPLVVVEPA